LKAKYVDEYKWIKEKDALDLVAIAQSMPGVVAINSAVILGYKMRGVKGTLTALLATVLPPLITLSLICIFYNLFATNPYVKLLLKGMQCGATALIINVAYDLLKKEIKKKYILSLFIICSAGMSFIFLALFNTEKMPINVVDIDCLGLFVLIVAFIAVRKKVGIIKILAGSGVLGLILGLIGKF
jgi:chromate transport protein ChrA